MADHILRPAVLDLDPSTPNVADSWTDWRYKFENFLSATKASGVDPFAALTNYVNTPLFKHIIELKNYDLAMDSLEKLFVQPKNVIVARHLLSTAVQEAGQNINDFLQKLKSLASDCEFQAVSAETHCEEHIRDAFIRGLRSNAIRLRLLEHHTLTLQSASDIARQLETAQKESLTYNQTHPISCSTSNPDDFVKPVMATSAEKCYFCGMKRHSRFLCPAREAVCKNCGKKGHFQKVCLSNLKQNRGVSASIPTLSSIASATFPACLTRAITSVKVNGILLNALIDTGSSESYISQAVVYRYGWKVHQSSTTISMASNSLITKTAGHCFVNSQSQRAML